MSPFYAFTKAFMKGIDTWRASQRGLASAAELRSGWLPGGRVVGLRPIEGNKLLRYRGEVGPSRVPAGCVAATATAAVYSTQTLQEGFCLLV